MAATTTGRPHSAIRSATAQEESMHGFLLCSSLAALLSVSDPPLIQAVKNRDIEAVRAQLKQRVDVNAPQGDGATALHWAAHRDDLALRLDWCCKRRLIDTALSRHRQFTLGSPQLQIVDREHAFPRLGCPSVQRCPIRRRS